MMILYNIIIMYGVVIVCAGVPNEAAYSGRRHARVMPGGGGGVSWGRLMKKKQKINIQPARRSDSAGGGGPGGAMQCRSRSEINAAAAAARGLLARQY